MFSKPTYAVQGHVFTLKPTSPRNRKLVNEFLEAQGEKTRNMTAEDMEGIDTLEKLQETFDDYRAYLDLFRLVTDGPHDKLDFEDFDIKVTEAALADFFPNATLIAMRQLGFLTF